MKTPFDDNYKLAQIMQIMEAMSRGSQYLYKDYNQIATNADWLNFTDAANSVRDLVDEWSGWIDVIRTEASDLLRRTDPVERRILAKVFIKTVVEMLDTYWEGYR
jgi:hypothetical protein